MKTAKTKSCKSMCSIPRPLCITYSPRSNSFARVTGTIKTFGTKKYINATHIRPVRDPHEPFYHVLEAMTVQLIFDRGPVRTLALVSWFIQPISKLARCPFKRPDHGRWCAVAVCILCARSPSRGQRPILPPPARPTQYRSIHVESAAQSRRRARRCYRKGCWS